jgi:hypothetical protein
VVAVHWSSTPQDTAAPHEITILAAHDNAEEENEGLPLARAVVLSTRPTMSSCDMPGCRVAARAPDSRLQILRLLMNTQHTTHAHCKFALGLQRGQRRTAASSFQFPAHHRPLRQVRVRVRSSPLSPGLGGKSIAGASSK